MKFTEIGQYCRNSDECYQYQMSAEEQSMTCNYGECTCRYGYYSIDNTECLKESASAPLEFNKLIMIFVILLASGFKNEI